MILLAIVCLGTMCMWSRELSIVRGREVSVGNVYAALGRLKLKG